MPRVEADLDTKLDPGRVVDALIDFTERRPEIWSGLKPEAYEVYEIGDTWAEIREGNSKGIWARERYDWSEPGTVKWTVIESPFSSTGDSVTATVKPNATGSHVHILWRRRGKTTKAKVGLAVLSLFMSRLLRVYFRKTLDGIADGTKPQPRPPSR